MGLSGVCGLLTAVFGFVAMLGWIAGITPLTAFCFVLAGVSLPASLSSSGRRWQEAAAFGSVSLLVLTSVVLLLAYLLGSPLLYRSGFIPPALPTSMAFLFLGAGLALASGQRIWPHGTSPETAGKRAAAVLTLIFFLSATGIVSAGYLRFRNFQRHFRAEAESTLSAIAALKVSELVQWRKERMGDAAVFFKNDNFAGLVHRFLENPEDADLQGRLRMWLDKVQAANQYDRVFLLDAQGVERMSAPDTAETTEPHFARDAPAILRSERIDFLDFHRESPQEPVHLSMLVPILTGPDNGPALGILGFRIDPETYLYPLLKHWPTPSRTAETLVVRRDGNDALFLNQLKFQADTALKLRSPMTNTKMPAVKAVLGQEGIMEGIDYRGVPVVAALRGIPDSPWFLVARMDMAEVYAPLQQRLWQMIVFVVTLVLGAGAGVGMVWRHQRARFYRERYEAEQAAQTALRDSEERYRLLSAELEERVAERTAQFDASNKELEAFAYSVSHDLRAPLRAIDGFSRIVLEDYGDKMDAEGNRLLNVVRSNTQQMDRLITDLLAMSRATRTEMRLSPIDMTAMAQSIYHEAASPEDRERFELAVAPLPEALGDPALLRQVWQNLLANAIKYTTPKEVRSIEVGGYTEKDMNIYFVKDSGVGFNPEYTHKLFGVFQRLHKTEEFEGTGIGLAIVQRIVHRHGGKVWAEGKIDEGATFYFSLPGKASDHEQPR